MKVKPGVVKIHKRSEPYVYKMRKVVCIDLDTKYAEVLAIHDEDGVPGLWLDAGEDSLYKNLRRKKPTEINFPEFKGWDIRSASISKWSLTLAFVK